MTSETSLIEKAFQREESKDFKWEISKLMDSLDFLRGEIRTLNQKIEELNNNMRDSKRRTM